MIKRAFSLVAMLFCLAGSVAPVQSSVSSSSTQMPGQKEAKTDQTKVFAGESAGWYWVYEGVAHAQSFVATGGMVESLQLRVAQLNRQLPTGSLHVEIRGRNMKNIYVHGTIAPTEASIDFRWVTVKLDHVVRLEQGATYVLLLHSTATEHTSPWIVNAVYKNLYPDGRHLGYADDLLFAVTFTNGQGVRVGPSAADHFKMPVNSGFGGAQPAHRNLALGFPRKIPTVAMNDLKGPLPAGRKLVMDVE